MNTIDLGPQLTKSINRIKTRSKTFQTTTYISEYSTKMRVAMLKLLNKFGFKKIAEGCDRLVFSFPDGSPYILKVQLSNPKDLEANARTILNQNQKEIAFFNKYKDEYWFKEYFVPILAHDPDGLWLIMPKVSTCKRNSKKELELYSNAGRLILDFIRSIKELYFTTYDFHEDNIGFNGSKYVVLDYGIVE